MGVERPYHAGREVKLSGGDSYQKTALTALHSSGALTPAKSAGTDQDDDQESGEKELHMETPRLASPPISSRIDAASETVKPIVTLQIPTSSTFS